MGNHQMQERVGVSLLLCVFLLGLASCGGERGKHFAYTLTPQEESFVDTAPERYTLSTVMEATPEAIWEKLDDTPGFMDWFNKDLQDARYEVESETGLGANRFIHMKDFQHYNHIIVYDEGKKWGITLTEGSQGLLKSIVEVIYLEPIDENTTRVVYKGGVELSWFGGFLSGTIKESTLAIWTEAFANLKADLEK